MYISDVGLKVEDVKKTVCTKSAASNSKSSVIPFFAKSGVPQRADYCIFKLLGSKKSHLLLR